MAGRRRGIGRWLAGCALAAVVSAQAATPSPSGLTRIGPRAFGDRPSVPTMTELGAQIFNDPHLSASGTLACASCHDPAHAFGPGNALPVQRGGANMQREGFRAAPSLMYLQTSIPFTEHYIDDEDGHGNDAGPTGGLTWDGRVGSPHAQALIPLFSPNEMANRDNTALAKRARRASYADAFRAAFSAPGSDVFDDPKQVVAWLAMALEVYQQSAPVFYPFTSKYDAVLRRQAELDPAERRGLALFNNPTQGNCASCHPSGIRSDGGLPLFTDAGHIAIGVPRNAAIAANRDARFHDLGLCGPLRTDLKASDASLCGRFKAPSLRNVALRQSFFHNGALHSLDDVMAFYVTRDTDPGRWYPRGRDGQTQKFDDLPARYHANVNAEAPFLPLSDGKPRLNESQMADVIAFLKTLTDGYSATTNATANAR